MARYTSVIILQIIIRSVFYKLLKTQDFPHPEILCLNVRMPSLPHGPNGSCPLYFLPVSTAAVRYILRHVKFRPFNIRLFC